MKNLIKLFVVVLAMAFVFISCEKGGTIEVINKADGDPETGKNYVIIVKGVDLAGALKDLTNGNGTPMEKDQKKSFSFDEDGVYTVIASFPVSTSLPYVFHKEVTLLWGNSETVTIK